MTLTAPALPPHDADLVKAALDRLDHTAHQAERRWGIGRLRLLVDDLLRARFDRQARLLDDVLWASTGDGITILSQINAMCRGWAALERTATDAGHVPMPPTWGEAIGPDGKLFMIVNDNAEASLIAEQAAGREAAVFTFAEVARLLTAWPTIATAKVAFPGAIVTELRPTRPVDWAVGDDIPGFGP